MWLEACIEHLRAAIGAEVTTLDERRMTRLRWRQKQERDKPLLYLNGAGKYPEKYRDEITDAPATDAPTPAWDWRSFEVRYTEISATLCIGGYFLYSVIPVLEGLEADAATDIRDVRAFAVALTGSAFTECAPGRVLACLRCLRLLLQHAKPSDVEHLPTIGFIAWLLQQCMVDGPRLAGVSGHWRKLWLDEACMMLPALFRVCRNVELFASIGGIPVLTRLLVVSSAAYGESDAERRGGGAEENEGDDLQDFDGDDALRRIVDQTQAASGVIAVHAAAALHAGVDGWSGFARAFVMARCSTAAALALMQPAHAALVSDILKLLVEVLPWMPLVHEECVLVALLLTADSDCGMCADAARLLEALHLARWNAEVAAGVHEPDALEGASALSEMLPVAMVHELSNYTSTFPAVFNSSTYESDRTLWTRGMRDTLLSALRAYTATHIAVLSDFVDRLLRPAVRGGGTGAVAAAAAASAFLPPMAPVVYAELVTQPIVLGAYLEFYSKVAVRGGAARPPPCGLDAATFGRALLETLKAEFMMLASAHYALLSGGGGSGGGDARDGPDGGGGDRRHAYGVAHRRVLFALRAARTFVNGASGVLKERVVELYQVIARLLDMAHGVYPQRSASGVAAEGYAGRGLDSAATFNSAWVPTAASGEFAGALVLLMPLDAAPFGPAADDETQYNVSLVEMALDAAIVEVQGEKSEDYQRRRRTAASRKTLQAPEECAVVAAFQFIGHILPFAGAAVTVAAAAAASATAAAAAAADGDSSEPRPVTSVTTLSHEERARVLLTEKQALLALQLVYFSVQGEQGQALVFRRPLMLLYLLRAARVVWADMCGGGGGTVAAAPRAVESGAESKFDGLLRGEVDHAASVVLGLAAAALKALATLCGVRSLAHSLVHFGAPVSLLATALGPPGGVALIVPSEQVDAVRGAALTCLSAMLAAAAPRRQRREDGVESQMLLEHEESDDVEDSDSHCAMITEAFLRTHLTPGLLHELMNGRVTLTNGRELLDRISTSGSIEEPRVLWTSQMREHVCTLLAREAAEVDAVTAQLSPRYVIEERQSAELPGGGGGGCGDGPALWSPRSQLLERGAYRTAVFSLLQEELVVNDVFIRMYLVRACADPGPPSSVLASLVVYLGDFKRDMQHRNWPENDAPRLRMLAQLVHAVLGMLSREPALVAVVTAHEQLPSVFEVIECEQRIVLSGHRVAAAAAATTVTAVAEADLVWARVVSDTLAILQLLANTPDGAAIVARSLPTLCTILRCAERTRTAAVDARDGVSATTVAGVLSVMVSLLERTPASVLPAVLARGGELLLLVLDIANGDSAVEVRVAAWRALGLCVKGGVGTVATTKASVRKGFYGTEGLPLVVHAQAACKLVQDVMWPLFSSDRRCIAALRDASENPSGAMTAVECDAERPCLLWNAETRSAVHRALEAARSDHADSAREWWILLAACSAVRGGRCAMSSGG